MSIFDSGDTGDVGGYTIANSLRLRSSAPAYLSRTLGVNSTSSTTMTWSGWVKRGAIGTSRALIAYHGNTAGNSDMLSVEFASDTLRVYFDGAGSTGFQTSAVYRDPSAWYHIVLAYDSTQATASNRAKLYVNGAQVTAFSSATYPALNQAINAASSNVQVLGSGQPAGNYLDGYLSDVYFIDGQALDPSYFGTTNSDGVWVPIAYSGTYSGTNSFYLPFNDGSNLTNLCLDRSGNGNNWTATNVSLTAGATYDWMVDTPTNNYAVLNPLANIATDSTLSNANLTAAYGTSATIASTVCSVPMSSGKWYVELQVTATSQANPSCVLGIQNQSMPIANYPGFTATSYGLSLTNGNKVNNGSATAYGSASVVNDVMMMAVDMDSKKVWFGINGTWFASGNPSAGTSEAFASLPSEMWVSLGDGVTSATFTANLNFGQRPFTYTPPTGFKALCTANLPAVTVTNGRKNFDVVTRNGFGTGGGSVSSLQFQPDMVWDKPRNTAVGHNITDSVRGVGKVLATETTGAEASAPTFLTAFNSNGFTMGAGDWGGGVTIVDWCWKAGGAAVTNTAGTITSQVSANTAAGFSIVTFTTNNTAGATVGHGLGVTPKLIISKYRSTITSNWVVYHASLGATQAINLSTTGAAATTSDPWNNTAPTSSVITLGAGVGSSYSTNYNIAPQIMYCFAEVSGFSKFGAYQGTGSSDGPCIITGGSGGFLMIKRVDVAGYGWEMIDAARSTENVTDDWLFANSSVAESSGVSTQYIDFLSNGFKIRTTDAYSNASGGTYVYAWFARNPFGGSNVAPATAR